MLKRVYIDNFLCFVNFEYRPERKQLLLGPNGSGKSSLLTAIRFLKKFVKGDENPFTQSTRTRWQDRPLQVLEIEALLDGRKYEYRTEIKFDPESRAQSVNLERLTVAGSPVFELANGAIRFFTTNGKPASSVPFQTAKSALRLSQLSNPQVGHFIEWLDSLHCVRIDAYPEMMDEKADKEEREPDDEFQNLAGWYRYLVGTYPTDNAMFLTSMKEVLSGFETLRFVDEETGARRLRADFTAPNSQRVGYAISELSEGQRCLFSLYLILHFLIAKGHTVFIDEPDNFISLREIQPWILAAEEKVEDNNAQLVLVSHHPELLNQWASKYGVRFFREGNGQVRPREI